MNVYEEVIDIMCDVFDRDPDELGPDTELVADLEAESVDFLELSMQLEERFSIRIMPERAFLQEFKSVYNSAVAEGRDPVKALRLEYPYMSEDRIHHHVSRIGRAASLAIRDIVDYVEHQMSRH